MDSKITSIYIWPIVTFLGLLTYKLYLIDEFQLQLTLNIITVFLLVTVILVLSIKRLSKLLQTIQTIIAILLITYHWLDTCIYIAIQNRLTLNNVVSNIKYHDVFIYFISAKLLVLTALVLIIPIVLRKIIISLSFSARKMNVITNTSFISLLILFFIVSDHSSRYGEKGTVIDLSNSSYSARSVTEQSLAYIKIHYASLSQRIEDYFDGKNWSNLPKNNKEKPNIIIVVSESLSMVDSKYAGGLFDRLPLIDKIQQDGLVFKNAVSNGKITAHGLAAFILGIQTTKTGGYGGMISQFPPTKFSGNNIISYAKKEGYQVIIISPGQPPSFYQMIQWFKEIGFNKIYDINADVFSASPRFAWKAPSDQAMYEAALNMIPKLKKPYLLVIETVSLHQPYILPDAKYKLSKNDILNQINYVDGTTYHFYQQLKKQGFLHNGFFILFGDHRRFEPLEEAEKNDGGYSKWHQRIVCSITGKDIAPFSVSTLPFSLVDMNTLLHSVVNGEPINKKTLLEATLSKQLGIDAPFSVSLVDDTQGTYLIRSENDPPLYISIYGKIPFDKIKSATYQGAISYLIKNDQQVNTKISAPTQKGGVSW